MTNYIVPHNFKISVEERRKLMKHSSFLLWFTGLSGSGKSTIANALEQELYKNKIHTYCLDGDNIRDGINKNLTFKPEDRSENIRRVAEIAKLLINSGVVVLASFVSPYKKDRKAVSDIVGNDNFIEIFINTSLEECERRDVKGLYKKARTGKIPNMTGISAPYEAPNRPDIEIITETESISASVERILEYINAKLEKHK